LEPARPRTVEPHVPRDLETVVLKALAKELARRITGPERAWRWCRRNPIVAALTASVVALLLVLLGSSLLNNARLEVQLERTEQVEKEKTDRLLDS
jgi:hypothetical protein